MKASEYFVTKTEKHTLIRKIGGRNFPIVSDTDPSQIHSIYANICNGKYTSERELFEDIYSRYSGRSVISLLGQQKILGGAQLC